MDNLSGKTVLLFSPRFFNYEVEIQASLREMGAQVRWFDERPSNSFFAKVLIRLNKEVVRRKIDRYYESILQHLTVENVEFDYILIISPECLSKEYLGKFKARFSKAKTILYMWDSFKNKGALDLLPLIDKAITFDPEDSKKYNLKLRALFYIDAYRSKKTELLYDLLFIGTAHSDRYNFVKKIISELSASLKISTYFFLSSKKLFWTKKLFDADFRNVKYQDVSFKALSHEDSSGLVHKSRIVLDINHPNQIGLTMRTLETLGAQKKIITTNADVINYDFYDPANILIIERKNPVIPESFLVSSFNPSSSYLLDKYSIRGWLKELFE